MFRISSRPATNDLLESSDWKHAQHLRQHIQRPIEGTSLPEHVGEFLVARIRRTNNNLIDAASGRNITCCIQVVVCDSSNCSVCCAIADGPLSGGSVESVAAAMDAMAPPRLCPTLAAHLTSEKYRSSPSQHAECNMQCRCTEQKALVCRLPHAPSSKKHTRTISSQQMSPGARSSRNAL